MAEVSLDTSGWAGSLAGTEQRTSPAAKSAHWFVDQLMDWADARGIGYLAWTCDAWPHCDEPTLITDYGGTPTAYRSGIRSHHLDRFGP